MSSCSFSRARGQAPSLDAMFVLPLTVPLVEVSEQLQRNVSINRSLVCGSGPGKCLQSSPVVFLGVGNRSIRTRLWQL